jgi:hypothetical protein
MLVKTGWQNDFGKQKFDVELNEIDLARILADVGIDPEAPVTSLEAFRLLMTEAEYFSETVRAVRLQDRDAGLTAARAQAARNDLLGKIKARLGLEQPVS